MNENHRYIGFHVGYEGDSEPGIYYFHESQMTIEEAVERVFSAYIDNANINDKDEIEKVFVEAFNFEILEAGDPESRKERPYSARHSYCSDFFKVELESGLELYETETSLDLYFWKQAYFYDGKKYKTREEAEEAEEAKQSKDEDGEDHWMSDYTGEDE